MRFATVWFLGIIFFFTPCWAEEDFPAIPTVVKASPSLPDCRDKKFKNLVTEKISGYYNNGKSASIIDKRRQHLVLKNLHDFTEIPVADFNRKSDYKVADKILMAKINNGLSNKDLRLCKSSVDGYAPVLYFLIYPESHYYMVDIVNFATSESGGKDFFVIYD